MNTHGYHNNLLTILKGVIAYESLYEDSMYDWAGESG